MEIPRQQRIDGVDGLGRRQFAQYPAQPGVGLEAVGTRRLDDRVDDGTRVSACGRVAEDPAVPSYYKFPFILPKAGRKLKSIIAGIRCMGAASRFEKSSSAAPAA